MWKALLIDVRDPVGDKKHSPWYQGAYILVEEKDHEQKEIRQLQSVVDAVKKKIQWYHRQDTWDKEGKEGLRPEKGPIVLQTERKA